MLILTRRVGETVFIGGKNDAGMETLFMANGTPVTITATMLGVKGNQIRVGVNAPKDVVVHREEIAERIKREQEGRGRPQG